MKSQTNLEKTRKSLLKLVMLLILSFTLMNCSKDDDSATTKIVKEYPENLVYRWDGFMTVNEMGGGQPINISWLVKANGLLEVVTVNQPILTGEWYMNGNIFTCTYTDYNGEVVTFQLIKSKTANMAGFKGLNQETSGAGRINMYVV